MYPCQWLQRITSVMSRQIIVVLGLLEWQFVFYALPRMTNVLISAYDSVFYKYESNFKTLRHSYFTLHWNSSWGISAHEYTLLKSSAFFSTWKQIAFKSYKEAKIVSNWSVNWLYPLLMNENVLQTFHCLSWLCPIEIHIGKCIPRSFRFVVCF